MKLQKFFLLGLVLGLCVSLVSCGSDKKETGGGAAGPQVKALNADVFFDEVLAKYDVPQAGHEQIYTLEDYTSVQNEGKEEYCDFDNTVTVTVLAIDVANDQLKLQTKVEQNPLQTNSEKCPLHTDNFQQMKVEDRSVKTALDEIRDNIKDALNPKYFCEQRESCSNIKLLEVSDVLYKGINAVHVVMEYTSTYSKEQILRETYTAKDDLALNVFEEKASYKSDGALLFGNKTFLSVKKPRK